jgi:NAD(P)-dependent dehydrogenase (short-subunit alcohol dehydrogenase family)
MNLEKKVAIVAGGGFGIGRAAAILLARKGVRVVIADNNPDAGQVTLAQIEQAGNLGTFVEADISIWEGVQKVVSFTLERYGAINVLFDSVGIYARARLADTDEVVWDRMMRVNVKSAFLLCKAVIPHMQAIGGGSIILTSSSVGWHDAAPNINAYATSKFAITGMTKAAACDYLKDGIRVNCICPGPTDTPMIRGGRTPEELVAFISSVPIQRLAEPEEVAQAVVFLASDESAYITGVALPVDGGQTAWL